jgi:hypothetical protein
MFSLDYFSYVFFVNFQVRNYSPLPSINNSIKVSPSNWMAQLVLKDYDSNCICKVCWTMWYMWNRSILVAHGLLIDSQYDGVACSNYFDAPFRNDKIELVILIAEREEGGHIFLAYLVKYWRWWYHQFSFILGVTVITGYLYDGFDLSENKVLAGSNEYQ